MLISICSILKLNGVHSIRNITKHNAIMLIIGKTSEENPISSVITLLIYVLTGKLVHLSASMRKVAFFKLHALDATVGKNKNIILSTIRPSLVQNPSAEEICNVPFITARKTVESLAHKISRK